MRTSISICTNEPLDRGSAANVLQKIVSFVLLISIVLFHGFVSSWQMAFSHSIIFRPGTTRDNLGQPPQQRLLH
ncbi:hypothetical protein BDR03DRAFT_236515 [Suillus americanus]|nr:hypothetical protein BDR03DRAFT_236515 [Suillus americanus]